MESSSHPGPESPGGKSRMPAVNGVGEPCAGEPHARFDAAGAGNGAPGHGHRSEAARRGNPGKVAAGPDARQTPPRQPPTLQRNSCDVAVLEMGEDERGAGDVADFAGAGGDVLEGAPALVEQGEPAFSQTAQRALDGVAGAGIDVEFPPVSGLFDRDMDANADAVVAAVSESGQ